MEFNIENLKKIATSPSNVSIAKEKYLDKNWDWIEKSAKIALLASQTLKEKGMNSKQLAKEMGVSPQHISKLLKGETNMTLSTICKLQKILEVQLIEVNSVFSIQKRCINNAAIPQNGDIISSLTFKSIQDKKDTYLSSFTICRA